MSPRGELTYGEIESAARRIADGIRSVVVAPVDLGGLSPERARGSAEVFLALEFMQHTGSFKARGALNFLRAQLEAETLPGPV